MKKTGQGFMFFTDYQVDFCTYKKDQDSNCSGSNAYDAAVSLKKRFDGLSLYQRKKIQSNLNTRGFYNNSIDGQWGLGTLIALVELSSVEFGTVDLRSEKMATKILALVW